MTDILDQIDDTLTDRCACGCGTALAADGPSVWYVNDAHQATHLAQQTTDPDAVYARQDAAMTLTGDGADLVDVPLTTGEGCDCVLCTRGALTVPNVPSIFSLVADAMDWETERLRQIRQQAADAARMREIAADASQLLPENRPDLPPAPLRISATLGGVDLTPYLTESSLGEWAGTFTVVRSEDGPEPDVPGVNVRFVTSSLVPAGQAWLFNESAFEIDPQAFLRGISSGT